MMSCSVVNIPNMTVEIMDHTEDFRDMPTDVVWRHIIPKLHAKEFRDLCEMAFAEGKHDFVRGMILPAFMQKYTDSSKRYDASMYACMTLVLRYMIIHWTFDEIRDFFHYYGIKEIECIDYDLFRTLLSKKCSAETWQYFIPCAKALASAHHLAINMNDIDLVMALETNIGNWEPYHVWCSIDMKREKVYEHYLESIQIYDDLYCQMRVSMLQAASGRIKSFEQVFCIVSIMGELQDKWIHQALKALCDTLTLSFDTWIGFMKEAYQK